MTTFAIFRPFPRLLKFTLLWSMVLQTKCRTRWMFGSSTFQQLSLKFVCKNGGNLTDLIAIYLWLVKIMSLFAGVWHYTQHSDVEAASWIELSLYFSRIIYFDYTCYLYSIIYLFIIVFLNLILRPGWRTKVTIHHHGKWKYRQRSCSLRMMD